jgi:hypothetical protein
MHSLFLLVLFEHFNAAVKKLLELVGALDVDGLGIVEEPAIVHHLFKVRDKVIELLVVIILHARLHRPEIYTNISDGLIITIAPIGSLMMTW